MRRARILVVALAAVATVPLLAGPLAAQTGGPPEEPSFVVLTGRLDVAEGDVFRDAVIFDGDATVAGRVVESVVAFNGDVSVTGTVGGDVLALGGRVTVASGAQVDGDVVSQTTAEVAEGAAVGGEVRSGGLPTDFDFGEYVAVSRVWVWLATSVSSLVLGLLLLLLAPRAGEAVAATATERFGLSIGMGFVAFFGLPIVAVIALITLVGIPLGVGILLALGLLFWMGYVTAALSIGRLLIKPPTSRLLAFLGGWAMLRVIAIVPGIGGIVWLLVTAFGLGALAVAARTAGRDARSRETSAVAVPPPPPMPSM